MNNGLDSLLYFIFFVTHLAKWPLDTSLQGDAWGTILSLVISRFKLLQVILASDTMECTCVKRLHAKLIQHCPISDDSAESRGKVQIFFLALLCHDGSPIVCCKSLWNYRSFHLRAGKFCDPSFMLFNFQLANRTISIFYLIEFNGKQLSEISNCFRKYIWLWCNSHTLLAKSLCALLAHYYCWHMKLYLWWEPANQARRTLVPIE